MAAIERYCEGPGPDGNPCDRPAFRGTTTDRPLCEAHTKQDQRTGRLTPITEELSPESRVIEAAEALMRASSTDDREYEARRRALLLAATALGQKRFRQMHREQTIKGLRRAKREGKTLGGRPKVEPAEFARALRRLKTVEAIARHLGISRVTVWRYKARFKKERR